MKIKSKKTIERENLAAWREICLTRDKHKCQICGTQSKKPHVHHIIPKQFKQFRYDINNGIVLCFNHHKVGMYSPHQNSLFFCLWLEKNKNEQYKYLLNKTKW